MSTLPRKPAVAAMAITAALAVAGPAAASPMLPSTVFDPETTEWASVRDLSSAAFSKQFGELSARGMMVVDLDVDELDGRYTVGAVLQRNADGRAWASLRDLTGSQFHTRWAGYRQQGYRLVDQETYVANGRRLWAGVWTKDKQPLEWASYRDVTSSQFSAKFKHYRERGFMPVDVDAYRVGSQDRFAAAWVKNVEGRRWRLMRGMTSAQFSAEFAEAKRQGLRTVTIDSVATPAGQRFASISIDNRGGRGWYAYRDLTAKDYVNRWKRLRDMGYRLEGFEKYDTASGARYAGVWRQDSDRPDWKLRERVDGLVEAERATHDVPGISVAVSQRGKLVYLRGFGYADIDDGAWMHGRSVLRTASVSKAVAGILGLRMDAKHASLSLSDPARDHLPLLPAHHTYTVGQTLNNTSCVQHYPKPFTSANTTHYDTALDAVKAFMDEPLACTPGTSHYSTHAYTVASAVFETLEGKRIDDIVRDELSKPFGLTTLRTENTAGSLPDRVTLYTQSNKEYAGDDMTNKPLGGGLVSSALDLVRLSDGVLDGTILNAAQRAALWPTNGDPGLGWGIGEAEGGQRMVGKSGGQPGAEAYLRVYPDDEIAIAVLTNRRGPQSPSALSKRIGELMLDQRP